MLVNLMLCSLLGSITVLCSAAISNFIDNFFNGDAAVLLSPVPYLIIPILFSVPNSQPLRLSPLVTKAHEEQSYPRRATLPMGFGIGNLTYAWVLA